MDGRVPVLGICYGMQTMAAQLGGEVENGLTREFGYAAVRARGHGRLLDGIQDRSGTDGQGLLDVWMSHGDKVISLPPGFALMASNEATPIAAMMDESRRFYGVQFHPEVTHTRQGKTILQRFVRDICGCPGDWTMPAYVDEAIAKIRAQVGDDEVILGLSGGVDSSVAAALIHRAIGPRLTCIFVDTGLLREGEAAQVMATFAEHLGVRVDMVDASEAFLRELAGVPTPSRNARSSAASSCTFSRRKPPSSGPEELRPSGWRRARSIRM
jgi:GMP synthase (glutamine-hydrolysing)